MAVVELGLDEAKKLFFDRNRMVEGLDRARRKFLLRAGGATRITARRLLRSKKTISSPGSPPNSHNKDLRNFIFFILVKDGGDEAVDIGPVKLTRTFFNRDRQPLNGTIPHVLEHGGEITILEVFDGSKWRRPNRKERKNPEGLQTRLRTVKIQPRPFMSKAVEIQKPKFPAMLADTFK